MLFRAPEYRKIDDRLGDAGGTGEIDRDFRRRREKGLRCSGTRASPRRSAGISSRSSSRPWRTRRPPRDRIKSGTSFAAIAAERGLKEQDIDLGTVAKSRHRRSGSRRRRLLAQAGRSERAGAGPVRRGHRHRAQDRTRSDETASPSSRRSLRNDIALERAKAQVQDIHDKIEDDRAGGATLEEAAEKLKLPVVTFDVDRSGRDPAGKPVVNLPHGAEVINAAFASDVGVDNDPIEADGGYVWYDVAAYHAGARSHARRGQGRRSSSAGATTRSPTRLKAKAADLLDKLKGGNAARSRSPRPTVSRSQTAADLKRGGAGIEYHAKDDRSHLPYRQRRLRQRRGRQADAMDRVPRDRRQDAGARSELAPTPRQSRRSVQTQLTDDMTGQYVAWLENDLGTTVNAERAGAGHGQQRAGHQLNADRAFGGIVRGALCGRRTASRVDDARRRSGNAGLRLPQDRRRAAQRLDA